MIGPVHDRPGQQTLTAAVMSKLPLGLLGFFGIKNGGQYPQTLGNVLIPQINLLDLLAVNNREARVFIATPAAVGFNQATDNATGLPAIVPPQEIWYLTGASIGAFTDVGDALSGVIAVTSRQSGSPQPMARALSQLVTIGASVNTFHPGALDVNGSRWFYPGDAFGALLTSFTNASGNSLMSGHYYITRFPL